MAVTIDCVGIVGVAGVAAAVVHVTDLTSVIVAAVTRVAAVATHTTGLTTATHRRTLTVIQTLYIAVISHSRQRRRGIRRRRNGRDHTR